MKRLVSTLLALVWLAAAFVPASAVTCSTQYTVVPGDNLFRIGVMFGIAWPQIAAANNLSNPSLIFPGQVLCIPSSVAATPGPTSTPAPTSTAGPTPTTAPVPTVVPFVVPTFSIVSVVQNTSVTIQTANFPPNQTFVVTMGPFGGLGVGGVVVTTTDSGAGGTFTATYAIPSQLAGVTPIAIRLQSASGFFSFNWFWNFTAP
jgi:LysM repeat protein